MINRIVLIFFSLVLFVVNVTAEETALSLRKHLQQQGVVYFQHADLAERDWDVLISHNRKGNTLLVYDNESRKQVYQYTLAAPTDTFIRLQWVELNGFEPLLATVWQRGVHGEQFILLDPAEKKQRYHLTSSWPLSFNACKEGIAVTIMKEGETVDTPLRQTHIWHNSYSVEIKNGAVSFCSIVKSIPPLDDDPKPASLKVFLQNLDEIIATRNFSTIKKLLADDVLNSFGGEGGKAEFVRIWKPRQAALFKQLTALRQGGGRLSSDQDKTQIYCMPRSFTDFPQQLDVFTHGVLTGKNIAVHASASSNSPVITRLSYSIVKIDEWQTSQAWQKVLLKQNVQGYVRANQVRSPIDYRACFVKRDNDKWLMTTLVAGD